MTFSCYRGFPFLRAERTCGWLKAAIDEAQETYRFDVWAYVFMPEHVHLLIRPRDYDDNIAAIRKAIKSPVGCNAIAWMEAHADHWLPRNTRKCGS